jgi:hypothetical protein
MTSQIHPTYQSDTNHDQPKWEGVARETLDLRFAKERDERYRQLKRDGIDGKSVGADTILEVVSREARNARISEDEIKQFESVPTIRRRIKNTNYMGDDAPYEYDKSDLPSQVKSYVRRLQILKAAMFKGDRLTNREAKESGRVLSEFQDPHGEKVDLIAQYAVLWELTERKATGKETSDIEDLFAFAPWVSDEASQLYRLALEKKLIKSFAILRLLAILLTPGSGNASVPPVFIGAHAHLNLPYIWSWVQEHQDKTRVFNVTYRDDPHFTEHNEHTTDAATLRSNCNWREFITLKLNDAPTETVTIGINRDEQEQSND